MKLYKLTNQNNKTRVDYNNETIWGENITHIAKGKGYELCTNDLIHAYESPELAIVLNTSHANIRHPKLWLAKTRCKRIIKDGQLKLGVKSLTTIKQLPIPIISVNQRIRFAILCALEIYKEEFFVIWANNWLTGKDRSIAVARATAARAGATAAGAAESAVARATAARAAESAIAAARATAAIAAARATAARAVAAESAVARATAARAAESAIAVAELVVAKAAAIAAHWAIQTNKNIDLIKLLKKAIKEEI